MVTLFISACILKSWKGVVSKKVYWEKQQHIKDHGMISKDILETKSKRERVSLSVEMIQESHKNELNKILNSGSLWNIFFKILIIFPTIYLKIYPSQLSTCLYVNDLNLKKERFCMQ